MLTEQKVIWLPQGTDEDKHIATCARICYASEKDSNSIELCNRLWSNGHRSMFRHAGVYYVFGIEEFNKIFSKIPLGCQYMECVKNGDCVYVSTNRQFARECLSEYTHHEIDYIQALNNSVFVRNGLIRYSFMIDTGIDISRELNRVSPNNIAERSTRYVDGLKKGISYKISHWMNKTNLWQKFITHILLLCNKLSYKIARNKFGLNLPPEDARTFLALGTTTRVIYTYTVNEWAHIINLRVHEITGKAHPDAKNIVNQIKNMLSEEGYEFVNPKENGN